MTSVLVPIADGTEEMEAVIIVDVLRRAGAEVCVASVMANRKTIKASRGVKIEADYLLAECPHDKWSLIALPGGMPGAEHLQQSVELMTIIQNQLEAQRWLAAICAAPAVVLGRHNLLTRFNATCHPAFRQELSRYAETVSDDAVVIDKHLITSQGAGTAMLFALTLVAKLFDDQKATEIAAGMVVNR